ncbi:MAG: hypothetical protein AAFZ18_03890 [Myxococcota bacterium]
MRKLFDYVGPPDLVARARDGTGGLAVGSAVQLEAALASLEASILEEHGWLTYTVSSADVLHLAPRRTEHVECARGGPVSAAGEIRFAADGRLLEVTNNSTGFCPDAVCWETVADVLSRLGLEVPERWTFEAIFRLCKQCGQRNLVKDDWFYCRACDAPLPAEWNFGSAKGGAP